MLPSAHPSPQLKRHLDWFSRFCKAHGRVSSACRSMSFPLQNCFFTRGSGSSSNTCFLCPPKSITQTASQSVQPFLHSSLQSDIRRALSPQNCHFPWGSGPRLTRGSLGPTDSESTASRSVSRFYTAHGRHSLYFTVGASFPPKLPLPLGLLDPIRYMVP